MERKHCGGKHRVLKSYAEKWLNSAKIDLFTSLFLTLEIQRQDRNNIFF